MRKNPFWKIINRNKATIDDKGNIYVAIGMLGVVQKFNKNGDFIKSILIKDDIDMIKNERDGIHVYAGKFDYTDYHITEKKIIEKNKRNRFRAYEIRTHWIGDW